MSGVNKKRLALLAVCLIGLTWSGCSQSRNWRWPWQKAPPTEVADIPSPAETIARIHKMGEAAASQSPGEQEQTSR